MSDLAELEDLFLDEPDLPDHLRSVQAAVASVEEAFAPPRREDNIVDLFDELLESDPAADVARAIAKLEEQKPAIPTLKDCIDFLAGRCNYASSYDGAGFNKLDTTRGHALADKPFEKWSYWDKAWAFRKIRFYRRQLEGAELRWELVEEPVKPEQRPAVKRVVLLPDEQGFGIQYSGLHKEDFERVRGLVTRTSGFRYVFWKDEETMPAEIWERYGEYGPIPGVTGFDSISAASIRAQLVNFGGFELTPEAAEAMEDLVGREERAKVYAQAVDAPDYDMGAAELKAPSGEDPWGHQRSLVRYAHKIAGFQMIVGDEPGTGKTLSAILASVRAEELLGLEGAWLICCPNPVKRQWAGVLRKVLPKKRITVLEGTGLQSVGGDILIANYDIFRLNKDTGEPCELLTLLLLKKLSVLICDESHFLKNPESQRTQAVLKLVKACEPRVRLALTGSMILNRVDELITQLEITGLMKHFGSVSNFKREYVRGRRFKELYEKLQQHGYMARTTEHHALSPEGKFMALTKMPYWMLDEKLIEREAECEDPEERRQLTAQLRQRVESYYGWKFIEGALRLHGRAPIDPPPLVELDDWAKYEYEHRQTQAWLQQMAAEYVDDPQAFARWMRAYALVRINKLRLAIAKRKLKEAVPYIEEILMEGEKVLLAVWHQEIAEAILKQFPGSATIKGGQSARERDAEKQRFIEDPDCKLMVANIQSGGTGLDGMQHCAHHVVFLEYPWNAGTLDQFERRLFRGGQKKRVLCHYVQANPAVMETIDQYMLEMIDKKKAEATAIMHGGEAPDDDMILAVVNKFLGRAA